MNEEVKYYLADFSENDNNGATVNLINEVQNKLDFLLPIDYIDVIKKLNGGEGDIGENSWLKLYPIEDLIQVNKDYTLLLEQIPDYFLIGKDAADTGYAFHKHKGTYHSFGLMSNFKTDSINFCGNNFLEFIKYIYYI